jgi:hypothetical protein
LADIKQKVQDKYRWDPQPFFVFKY